MAHMGRVRFSSSSNNNNSWPGITLDQKPATTRFLPQYSLNLALAQRGGECGSTQTELQATARRITKPGNPVSLSQEAPTRLHNRCAPRSDRALPCACSCSHYSPLQGAIACSFGSWDDTHSVLLLPLVPPLSLPQQAIGAHAHPPLAFTAWFWHDAAAGPAAAWRGPGPAAHRLMFGAAVTL
ncbi:hypothetical protein HaLaN_30955 [Haematococcus lacustris]|uniref:Uncharacterized protein n=1 Tax=Haematococcus lacustris TaxID=44745 RepID=A0A6A0AGR5_HAELA|nr:hypothetical protein HaLaN_30955 [Haematococcus lacustris]